MVTIGQVSEIFDLPISTLRFYDKSGLMPDTLPEEIQGACDYTHARDETGSERMVCAG